MLVFLLLDSDYHINVFPLSLNLIELFNFYDFETHGPVPIAYDDNQNENHLTMSGFQQVLLTVHYEITRVLTGKALTLNLTNGDTLLMLFRTAFRF